MSYITHTRNGSYCDVCGSALSTEEIEWDCCDCCGGEGFGDGPADAIDDYFPDEPENTAEATKP